MKKIQTLKFILLALAFLVSGIAVQAQDLLKGKDLSQVKVDQLSDADIVKLKAQLNSSGLTLEQAEQMAVAKGMSASEFSKLKARLAIMDNSGDKSATGKLKSQENKSDIRENNSSDSLSVPRYDRQKPKPLIDSLIFGSELYTSVAPSFEPNMNLATPVNYILGPGDVLSVSVYGVQVYDGELPVSAEGFVNIPNVGQIKLAGIPIEAATQKLKTAMGAIYSSLRSGGSKLSVTLSKIRSIKVNVIGSYFPGTFTVSSLATVFNVLYLAGGPREVGSFREIELIRMGEPIRKIDLYKFLVNGDQSDNIGLKDNDVIRIPTYKSRVELQGQVKRPGIFEVLPGESFADILAFASGFTDTAYMASVKIFQRSDRERKVHDLIAVDFAKYKPEAGDIFAVSKILNRFQNRVRITGAVFRPDMYELTSGLTAADLIRKADGLREDAYTGRAQILRLEEDLTRSIVSFDIRKALAGDISNNPVLQREDEILISAVSDLRDSFKVSIQGEIRSPGQYDYVNGLTLKDLVLQAGGFTDAAFKNIEIARLIRRDSLAPTDKRASTVINTNIAGDLSSTTTNIPLQPFDVITIRRKAGYTLPEIVTVTGQAQYPGPYALSKSDERVSDILTRAGGFAPDAYPAGAYIKRYLTDIEKQQSIEALKKAEKQMKDSIGANKTLQEEIQKQYVQIPLELGKIMLSPGSLQDITLKANDELYIPKYNAGVKISGSILQSTQIPYDRNNNFKDYISAAGGYSADAWKKGAYIVYANGRAASIKRFLFFKSYPKVQAGSEIVVPKRVISKGLGTGEIIGLSSAVASLAGVVIALLKL
jgi:protein involved in polysaccharide export with SLBB domain